MRALPLTIGPIHFVGIGGIGMSGIAEVLHTLGYQVQGSDISEGTNVARLREAGIPVAVGHDAGNLGARRSWWSPPPCSATTPRCRRRARG
jgi:UDP-N-acetylmuramate--alanine ligase